MQHSRGKVPHFTLRPHPGVTIALILVLIIGLLGAFSLLGKEDGSGQYRQQGVLVLIITGMLTFFLTIVATSKMWFTHLWKKNSTHARHKQHTRHHPSVKEQEFRNRR